MVSKRKIDSLLARAAADTAADDADERERKLRLACEEAKRAAIRLDAQRRIAEAEAAEAREALAASVGAQERWKPLKVRPREKSSRVHEATAVLLYSDLHPDETVTPGTVSDLNEFNPDVARFRNKELAAAARWNLEAIREHEGRAGYKIRDFILAMLGDMITNTIHPELQESNSMMPADALVFVEQLCCEQIDSLLADQDVERILIPCCHGNHDRMTVKIRHQTKAGNSLAWILYHHLAMRYRDEPRVQFDIAQGNMIYTDVYGRAIRWTHGDDVRYAGGVGGLTIPMRKAIDSWNQSHAAWLTCCGHWHQFIDHRDFMVNGSLIGYTAFAQAIKARFEPASQAFFIIDKDYGKGWAKPIQLQGKGTW
jgi:hypothetical protein